MLAKRFSTAQLEEVYDQLATAIDNAGEAKEVLLLTKLALILSNLVGDTGKVIEAIHIAEKDL